MTIRDARFIMLLLAKEARAASFRRPEPESNEDVAADGTVAIVGLDRGRKRIRGKVCADAGFDESQQRHVARVAESISADAERTAIEKVKALLDIRFAVEQLVFIDQFGAPRDEVPAGDRNNRLSQIGIQIVKRGGVVVAPPDKC